MKRVLLLLAALTGLILPSLHAQEAEQATVTFAATASDAGTLTATNTTTWQEINSGDPVAVGTQLTFRAAPKSGFYVSNWTVNGEAGLNAYNSELSYTVVAGTNNIEVNFQAIPAEGFFVTCTAGEHGTVKASYQGSDYNFIDLPAEGGNVPAWSWVQFTATPDEGYIVDKWTVNGEVDPWATSKEMGRSADRPLSVNVTFRQVKKYTVNLVATNGTIEATYQDDSWNTISVKDGDEVMENANINFIGKPNSGYKLDYFEVNGEVKTPEPFGNIHVTLTENITVKAVFKEIPPQYTITVGGGDGGYVRAKYKDSEGYNHDFDWQNDIEAGTVVTVYAQPDANYETDTWSYNGTKVEPMAEDRNLYQFTVSETANIYATFRPGNSGYFVRFEAGEHGKFTETIAYSGSGYGPIATGDKVSGGTKVSLTVTPDEGYEVDQWFSNDYVQTAYTGQTKYEEDITRDTNIRVTFKPAAPKDVPVHYSSSEGGTLLATYMKDGEKVFLQDNTTVPSGTEVSFFVNLEPGYQVTEWVIGNEVRTDLVGKTETTVVVYNELTVSVTCAKSAYKVSYSAGEGGTLTVQTAAGDAVESGSDVATGTELVLKALPNEGYEFSEWKISGAMGVENTPEVRLTVAADLTIQALFAPKAPATYAVNFSSSNDKLGTVKATNVATKAPLKSGDKVEAGTEILFEATSLDAAHFVIDGWKVNDKVLDGSKDKTTQTVTVEDADVTVQVLFRDATSIEAVQAADLQVYIAGEQLLVRGLSQTAELALYTVDGQLVFVRNITDATNVSALADGVYFVRLLGQSFKVVK